MLSELRESAVSPLQDWQWVRHLGAGTFGKVRRRDGAGSLLEKANERFFYCLFEETKLNSLANAFLCEYVVLSCVSLQASEIVSLHNSSRRACFEAAP